MDEKNIEHLHIHIEGLQATLTKRNARIAQLEEQVSALKNNPAAAVSKAAAYKQGWKACASHMMQVTHDTANQLAKVRKEAFKLYLEGDSVNG